MRIAICMSSTRAAFQGSIFNQRVHTIFWQSPAPPSPPSHNYYSLFNRLSNQLIWLLYILKLACDILSFSHSLSDSHSSFLASLDNSCFQLFFNFFLLQRPSINLYFVDRKFDLFFFFFFFLSTFPELTTFAEQRRTVRSVSPSLNTNPALSSSFLVVPNPSTYHFQLLNRTSNSIFSTFFLRVQQQKVCQIRTTANCSTRNRHHLNLFLHFFSFFFYLNFSFYIIFFYLKIYEHF